MGQASSWGVLILLGLLLAMPLASGVKVAPSEVVLLEEIKAAFNASSATEFETWNATLDCSRWLGLTCDAQGRVISMILKGTSTSTTEENSNVVGTLDGILSPSLGKLSQLQTLEITGNSLTGFIPPELGSLSNLQFLNVSNNILFGPLPPALGQLSKLRYLDASFNELTDGIGDIPLLISALNGTIPESFGNLLALEKLRLSNCRFEGTPPASLKKLTNLTLLDLSYTKLTGPVDTFLQPSSQLKFLNLAYSLFNETFPNVVLTLTNLESLDLSGNSFDGDIPASLENLIKLRYLDLSANSFTSVPDTLATLQKLQTVVLGDNALVGAIPKSIGLLPNLQRLELQNNVLSGQLPNFTSPTKLKILDLRNNFISGQDTGGLPPALGLYTNLEALSLDNNNFGGPFSLNFTALKKLEFLTCCGCNLIGPIPPEIGKLTKLINLYLCNNRLDGEIPSSLGNLKDLNILDLSGNQLTGAIPGSIGNMTNLGTLWLYNNQLTGGIPASLSQLSNLDTLSLSQNSLSGDLSFLRGSQAQYLFALDLSNNRLSGKIPRELGSFGALGFLKLSFNRFVGTLPYTLGNLTSLSELELRSCNLVGTVPTELGNPSLTKLDLSYNAFTGSLPNNFFDNFTAMTVLSISNTGIHGKIPNLSKLTALLNLDLSTNQFTSGLKQAFPASLVSLNISTNYLEGNLTNSFQRLKNLSSVNLDNNLLTGSVPLLNASVVSLANNNITLEGQLQAYTGNKMRKLLLCGNPICNKAGVGNQSACASDACQLEDFAMQPVCNTSCFGGNVPNPYIYARDQKCECAGFLSVNISITSGPFARFTDEALPILRNHISKGLGITAQQIFVTEAASKTDGSILVQMRLFSADSSAPSTASRAKLFQLWFGKSSDRQPAGVEIPNLGFISLPSVQTTDFQPPPPPPPVPTPPTLPGEPTATSSDSKAIQNWQIAIIVVAVFLLLIITVLVTLLVARRKVEQQDSFMIRLQEHFVRPIPLEEVKQATNNFSEKNQVGVGGYGTVYRGVTPTGEEWAVKRAKTVSRASLQEFETEVDIISKLAHANIVRLLGYCDKKNEQLLVYEFMAGGNLKAKLQNKAGDADSNPLTFVQRVSIAMGAAEGLRYLHNFAKPTIIHRDVKSENILLDESLKAKVADFGLLKDKSSAASEVMNTRVAGTPGYIDPDYYSNFQVTPKSDVYSFGVVLLELITGMGALIKRPATDSGDEPIVTTLANWVQPYLQDIKKIADHRLNGEYNEEAMELLVRLAMACIERAGQYRPGMDEVVRRLQKVKNVIDGVADETEGQGNTSGSVHSFSDASVAAMQVPSSSISGSVTSQGFFFNQPFSEQLPR